MKLGSERSFQSRVIRELKKIDGLYFFKKEAAAIRGIMDIIICYDGKFFGWELKRSSKEKPTKLQEYNICLVKNAGGVAKVVCPENFEESLRELLNGRNMERCSHL